ncbi:hypothetical protein LOAG_11941, partial [Loa loa]
VFCPWIAAALAVSSFICTTKGIAVIWFHYLFQCFGMLLAITDNTANNIVKKKVLFSGKFPAYLDTRKGWSRMIQAIGLIMRMNDERCRIGSYWYYSVHFSKSTSFLDLETSRRYCAHYGIDGKGQGFLDQCWAEKGERGAKFGLCFSLLIS